jgi:hypothetical protein
VATINPEDAYTLALIAKKPEENRDLLDALSPEARPIGDNLVEPAGHVVPEISEAAEALRRWAKRTDE